MNLKCIILAGGMGTRMRPYTFAIPKPLLPIGNRPIIELTMYWLKSHGVTDAAVALGYHGDLIRAYLGDGARIGMHIAYAQERSRMGTAGPLTLLRDWIGDSDVFVMNSDIMTQMDLNKFASYHESNRAMMTVATRLQQTKSPFGVLKLESGQVRDITEKPIYNDHVSAGMYVLANRALGRIPQDEHPYDITALMKALLHDNARVSAYQFDDPWIAVEHLGDYNDAINGEWQAWANSLEHRSMQLSATSPLQIL